MRSIFSILIVLFAVASPPWEIRVRRSLAAPRDTSARLGQWATERVEMTDGRVYRGLIESRDDHWLYLIEIHQPRGRSTYLVIRALKRSAIARLERLDPQQQAELEQRVGQWLNRARIEAGRMDAVRLAVVDRHHERFQHYRGKWFDLDSNTDEPSTRRMIVRIERMFTAYRQVVSPRTDARSRLRLVILGSLDKYRTYLERYGTNVGNPAVFLQKENLVVAGSQLARYIAQLEAVEAQHARVREELRELEEELQAKLRKISKQLQTQGIARGEITRLLNQAKREAETEIKNKRTLLKQYDRENREAFDQVTRQMFGRLYHEAFHAYLENYVYPHDRYDVPVWLNEGLAMLFEIGILESDTLRLDAPNAAALKRLKAEIRKGRSMPLTELLAAGPEQFLTAGNGATDDSDRYYAYAWGLVHYLAFEKRALRASALDAYVDRSNKDLAPARRLEILVDEPLPQLQSKWREYILRLR